MHTPPLDLIWQRDLSRPRYQGPDDKIRPFAPTKPREYGWICALLRSFPLRHHPDDRFEVDAPAPIVVLEGDNYNPARVRDYLRRLRANTRGVGLLHIGDEFRRAPLEVYDEAAFVYRNYWRPALETHAQGRYLPLGANCPMEAFDPPPFSERRHRWSFAGQQKGPRETMIDTVSQRSDGYLQVNDNFNSGLPKEAYVQLLERTQVVLCPRGFSAVESYRVYEALEAGAIPLVEDDGGVGLWHEHLAPAPAWTALTGGPSYWYDLARRSRRPSYWHSAYGSGFPCPRIYRWDNVDRILDSLDLAPLAAATHTWWTNYKSALRSKLATDIQRHLHPSQRAPLNAAAES